MGEGALLCGGPSAPLVLDEVFAGAYAERTVVGH